MAAGGHRDGVRCQPRMTTPAWPASSEYAGIPTACVRTLPRGGRQAAALCADLAPGFVEMGSEDGVRVAGEAVARLRSFKQTMR